MNKIYLLLIIIFFLSSCTSEQIELEQIEVNEPSCSDNDDDGYYSGELCGEGTLLDCDDTSSEINRKAEEICDDGIDNDCDEKIDDEDTECYGCENYLDCDEGENCENNECVSLNCGDCQYYIGIGCYDYACCSDEDCNEGLINTNYTCLNPGTDESECALLGYIEEESFPCESDDVCYTDYYCIDGFCEGPGFYFGDDFVTKDNMGDFFPLLDDFEEISRTLYVQPTFSGIEGPYFVIEYSDNTDLTFEDIYEESLKEFFLDGWAWNSDDTNSYRFNKFFEDYLIKYYFSEETSNLRIYFTPEGTYSYDSFSCLSDSDCTYSLYSCYNNVCSYSMCESDEVQGFVGDFNCDEEIIEEEVVEEIVNIGSEPWDPPVPGNIINCVEDYDCFLSYVDSCTPAKVYRKQGVELFGIIINATYTDQIRGFDSEDCVFYIKMISSSVSYSDTFTQTLLEQGVTEDEINLQLIDSNEQQQLLVGREGWCKFTETDLYGMLSNWNQGFYSWSGSCELNDEGKWVCSLGGDFAVAEDCQGDYFDPNL